ncbi:MAG: hypothetical protein AAF438_18755 [Pseudomonadota bacterium]
MSTPTEAFILKQVYALAVEEMAKGSDKFSIIDKLEEMGVDRTEAASMVESVYAKAKETVFDERASWNDVLRGSVGGLLVAVLGGALWAALTTLSDMEVTFVAWILGAACGYTVLKTSGGRRGVSIQVAAALCCVFGVLLAKYGAFFYSLKELFVTELGAASVVDMTMFSWAIIGIFFETLPAMVNPWMILWVSLSVATAWLIPKSYFPVESPLTYKHSSI